MMDSKTERFIKAAVVCIVLFSIAPLYAATPWLHTDANLIKDPAGNVVVLRGLDTIDIGEVQVNRGGVINLIDRITNKSDSSGSSPGWHPRVIRLAVYPSDEEDFHSPFTFNANDANNTYYNTFLRPVVDYCKTKDLYVIIDWHYVGNDTGSKVVQTSAFWSYMAQRFATDSHVLFELFNEPGDNGGSYIENWLTCRPNMQTWINVIRTYAPNNLILVGGPAWSQQIGPAADYPLDGDNLVMVVHLYPGHWTGLYGNPEWYKYQVTHCLTRYPVFSTEWGFRDYNNLSSNLNGTIANYGQPLMDFYESLKISNSAWVTDYSWQPEMFTTSWGLRVGPGEMGGFVKDTLYARRNDDQPVSNGDDILPTVSLTSPLDGAVFDEGDDIVMEANASDSDGYVTKVEFYAGGVKIGEDTNAPYSCTWTDVPVGQHALIAKATDNNNLAWVSSVVNISVYGGEATGTILREYWTGIGSSTSLTYLTSDINFPTNPNGRELITKLEGPVNWADRYGTRIRGYVYPPADGNYTFWLSCDNSGELWLSTDTDPCNKSRIAYTTYNTAQYEWTKYPEQQSPAIPLLADHKYYIEVLHKEATGTDHVEVAWQGPTLSQQVIDGVFLSPWLYNFKEYSGFAGQWQRTGCARANAWCSGADRDRDGNVQIDDLIVFADWWLLDTE